MADEIFLELPDAVEQQEDINTLELQRLQGTERFAGPSRQPPTQAIREALS